ncbi:DUF1380 domain-containing protein [Erwinia mallotivora]|uniref:DUF1380 domain-containing protein n=1 Tax=Erwinia mallotivora TaxID=69222 RepID=UPI0021C23B5D|nr:DUF1380 domain-containing protein [Erwinia mallotivora]
MFGTRKEINKTLKRAFGDSEKIAVLVWTREDLMAVETMTQHEAEAILCQIGNVALGDHIEEGVSVSTVTELLAALRMEPGEVTLDAKLLERVVRVAESALMAESGLAWNAVKPTPEAVRNGLADVAYILQHLKP